MAYATIDDLVLRYGQAELMRLTTPLGQDMVAVQEPLADLALGDASYLIDGYLRKRYQVPLDVPPPEIARACCLLARFDLSTGDGKEPSDQLRLARKDTIAWLERIASGLVLLDLTEVETGDNSFAIMQDRAAIYGGDAVTQYPGAGNYPLSDPGLGDGDPTAPSGVPVPAYGSQLL